MGSLLKIRITWFSMIKTKPRQWATIVAVGILPRKWIQYHTFKEHIYRITPTLPGVNLNITDLLSRITTINPNKASDPDLIAPQDLYLIGEGSVEGLFTVFRQSLRNSTVPSQWKVFRMLTTHKKGNKTDRGKYRGLPSKLMEGLVCESVDSFTTDTGHLNDNQWSFRRDRSTEELLIYLAETRKAALDKRKVVFVVYTDFQKAFDTVSHEILIYKLQAMGFRGNSL